MVSVILLGLLSLMIIGLIMLCFFIVGLPIRGLGLIVNFCEKSSDIRSKSVKKGL